jgi:leucyl/phenylalanyl-tRNA--protein transferase
LQLIDDYPTIDMSLVELVIKAYRAGIFPMSESADSKDIFWVDPDNRGVIPLDQFHLSHRFRKTLRHHPYEIRHNTAFEQVLALCAQERPGREQTWISPKIKALYLTLFRLGFSHSLEVWDKQKNELVGGLYGVMIAGAYFGESMFSLRTDTSKIALAHLVARLQKTGFKLLDTQFVTDHLRQFGAREISRTEYHEMLTEALKTEVHFYEPTEEECLVSLLQSITQMS